MVASEFLGRPCRMSKYNDPEHWWTRAAEAHLMADRIIDSDAKQRMIAIAREYEKIAHRAAERLKASTEGRPPFVTERNGGDGP